MSRVGTFLGREIYLSTDTPECRPEEIRAQLGKFSTVNLLRTVGQMADEVYLGPESQAEVTLDALAYIARAAIEAGSDENTKVATPEDIRTSAHMYHNLREPKPTSVEDAAVTMLLRMGYTQAVNHPSPGQLLARSWYLYQHLWPSVEKARAFHLAEALEVLLGITYDKALAWGFAYWGSAKKGFTSPYPEVMPERWPLRYQFSREEGTRFYDWMSCTYEDVKQAVSQNDEYEKFSLSPFLDKPFVKPDVVPDGASPGVRVVPIPSFVLQKVTSGIYHSLSNSNNYGGKTNPFRTAFGHVLEAYVGELLKAGSGASEVIPEFDYEGARKSPDWFVIDGSTIVAVEVKLSAFNLQTKMRGDVDAARDSLRKTLGKGVEQLLEFRERLVSGRISDVRFENVNRVSLLVVTQDDIPHGNFVLHTLLPGAKDVQFVSVEELELLQRYCWGKSPFAILSAKQEGRESSEEDLGQHLSKYYGSKVQPHPFLQEVTRKFFEALGLDTSRAS